MITLETLNSADELYPLLESYNKNGWELDLNVRDVFINEQGRKVSNFYCGRSFSLQALATKQCSTIEKVIRVICGVLATVLTLGLALLLQSVRNLFKEGRKAVGFVTFDQDSGPDRLLNGMGTSSVTAFKVDKTCSPILCGQKDCSLDHGSQHQCKVSTSDGRFHDISLDDITIRDHLEWLNPSIVEADYSHFAHAGDFKL
ncbi:hypothetical protein [Estrella lausannensis]|uniref:Putative membrane protein n=1 Tax=Estrella lausannensis TaxID=483423 RepID=A0A0H5E386_9BACT|nr:hypothetical protein [Estrella lausannensis]CRX37675.1 putative membrane protein [Estrella lausannensis]